MIRRSLGKRGEHDSAAAAMPFQLNRVSITAMLSVQGTATGTPIRYRLLGKNLEAQFQQEKKIFVATFNILFNLSYKILYLSNFYANALQLHIFCGGEGIRSFLFCGAVSVD